MWDVAQEDAAQGAWRPSGALNSQDFGTRPTPRQSHYSDLSTNDSITELGKGQMQQHRHRDNSRQFLTHDRPPTRYTTTKANRTHDLPPLYTLSKTMASPEASELRRPHLTDATKQIRLLRFLPGDGTGTDHIQCKLSVHDIDDVQEHYVAISYAWGEAANMAQIFVDGYRIPVRFNCWYALWQVRLHAPAKAYWIDSICIDQECHGEKQHQVSQMGKIYSQGRSVAACIGQPDEGLNIFKFLMSPPQNAEDDRVAAVMRLNVHLAKIGYFERLWTVQECMLAKEITIHWGECAIPWLKMWSCCDWRAQTVKSISDGSDKRRREVLEPGADDKHHDALVASFTDFANFQDDCMCAMESSRNGDNPLTRGPAETDYDITKMIMRYSWRHCQDSHDKLYGLLPLASRAVRERIPIDYERPLFQVLPDYTRAFDVKGAKDFCSVALSANHLSNRFAAASQDFADDLERRAVSKDARSSARDVKENTGDSSVRQPAHGNDLDKNQSQALRLTVSKARARAPTKDKTYHLSLSAPWIGPPFGWEVTVNWPIVVCLKGCPPSSA